MKTVFSAVIALGAMTSMPAWAQEGAGDPFPVHNAPLSTEMTMKAGGDTDPFRWSARPASSQMGVVRGGNTDPYRWSASPLPPAAKHDVAGAAAKRNPG